MSSKKAKETEKRILDAAIKVFSEKGFSASTTSEIAKEANVAEGTIFRYFPKKKDLLHGIVYKVVEVLGEHFVIDSLNKVVEENKDKPIKELLKAIALDRVKLFEKLFPHGKVILYEIQFHEDVRELFIEKIANKAIEMGEKIFEEGKGKGEFRDINPLIAVRCFIGMVFTMLIQRQFIPSRNQLDNIEEEIEMLLDIFLNGVCKKN